MNITDIQKINTEERIQSGLFTSKVNSLLNKSLPTSYHKLIDIKDHNGSIPEHIQPYIKFSELDNPSDMVAIQTRDSDNIIDSSKRFITFSVKHLR